MDGKQVLDAAIEVVLAALRANPAGLTNAEVARITGLELQTSAQNRYITWTILQFLVEHGQVTKTDKTYRLRR